MSKRSRQSNKNNNVSKRSRQSDDEKCADNIVKCHYCYEKMNLDHYVVDKCSTSNCPNNAPACCDFCNDHRENIHEDANQDRQCVKHWKPPIRQ